jgi:two-component system, LytTR family, sensor kinase
MDETSESIAGKTLVFSRHQVRRWALIVLSCTVGAILFSSVAYVVQNAVAGVKPEPIHLFLWWLTRFYLWAAFAPAVGYFLKRVPLEPFTMGRVFFHLFGSLIFGLLQLVLHSFVAFLLLHSSIWREGSSSILSHMVHNYPLGILAYWAIAAIVGTASHYERLRYEELQSSVLKAHLAEARLRALQMQLQPHFVFNALHSLSDLVMEEPKTAVRLIARLGDFMRLTLHNSSAQSISLRSELEFLEAYLEIERIRYGNRLSLSFKIDPASLEAEVPNLILQPLVENAVRHGVASQVRGGTIGVATTRSGESLILEVRDDGPGIANPGHEGIGLQNTRQRLRAIYGENYLLTIQNGEEGGAVVTCKLPYRPFREVEADAHG